MFKNLFKNFNVNNIICRSVGNVIIVDEEAEVAGVTEPHEDVESVDASHDPPSHQCPAPVLHLHQAKGCQCSIVSYFIYTIIDT